MSVANSVSASVSGRVGKSISQAGMQGVSAPILIQNIVSESNDNLITETGAVEIIKE